MIIISVEEFQYAASEFFIFLKLNLGICFIVSYYSSFLVGVLDVSPFEENIKRK